MSPHLPMLKSTSGNYYPVAPPESTEEGTSDAQQIKVASTDSSTTNAQVPIKEEIQFMIVIDTDSIQKDDYVLSKYGVTYLAKIINIDDEDDKVENQLYDHTW